MAYIIQTSDAVKKIKPPIKPEKVNPFQSKNGLILTYERALKGISREIKKLIDGYGPNDPVSEQALENALNMYAEIIGPWALRLSGKIFSALDVQNKYAWRKHTDRMSIALKKELEQAPTGAIVQSIMKENVKLIKSIPIQAAERIRLIVQANMTQNMRADTLAEKILETADVTRNRAILIARTEISKATTALTRARAEQVGSEGYIWQTVGDMIVRPSHKKMKGKFVRWDAPPILDKMTGHAGEFPNCRCWPEVVFPES